MLGLVHWLVTRFSFDGETLHVETGLLRRDTRKVPVARIQAVDVVQPFIAKVLDVAELRIRVAGSGKEERLAYLHHDARPRAARVAPRRAPRPRPVHARAARAARRRRCAAGRLGDVGRAHGVRRVPRRHPRRAGRRVQRVRAGRQGARRRGVRLPPGPRHRGLASLQLPVRVHDRRRARRDPRAPRVARDGRRDDPGATRPGDPPDRADPLAAVALATPGGRPRRRRQARRGRRIQQRREDAAARRRGGAGHDGPRDGPRRPRRDH